MAGRNNQTSKSKYRFIGQVTGVFFLILFILSNQLYADGVQTVKKSSRAFKSIDSNLDPHPRLEPIAHRFAQESLAKKNLLQLVDTVFNESHLSQEHKKRYGNFFYALVKKLSANGDFKDFLQLLSLQKACADFKELEHESEHEHEARLAQHVADRLEQIALYDDPIFGNLFRELEKIDRLQLAKVVIMITTCVESSTSYVADQAEFFKAYQELKKQKDVAKKIEFITTSRLLSLQEKIAQLQLIDQGLRETAIYLVAKIDWKTTSANSAALLRMIAKEILADPELEKLVSLMKKERQEFIKKEELRWKPIERGDFLFNCYKKNMPAIIQKYEDQLSELESLFDAYALFGIQSKIIKKELETKKKKLLLKSHPDKPNGNVIMYQKATKAYDLLHKHIHLDREQCISLINQLRYRVYVLKDNHEKTVSKMNKLRRFVIKKHALGQSIIGIYTAPYTDLNYISEKSFLAQFGLELYLKESFSIKSDGRPLHKVIQFGSKSNKPLLSITEKLD